MISLHLTNAIGVNLSVALNSEDDLLDAMRAWGRKRWRTISLPYGGLHFPLAMAQTFDWSIIGAQPDELKNDESGAMEPGVWFENRFYKRRDLPANEKKKMGAAVKYSRGANDTDRANPNILVEGDDKFGYVTLVIFRGEGRAQVEYERPRAAAKPQAERASDDDAPISPELLNAIAAAAKQRGMGNRALIDLSIQVNRTPGYHTSTMAQGRKLFDAIAHLPAA
jgi:hypothetical protein